MLAVAVTVIEVGLIVTLMISGGSETDTLARDTVFAAAMITCNGIAGLALLIGAVAGSRGFTLTASVASLSYDSLADVFSEIARRFRPGPTGNDDEEAT